MWSTPDLLHCNELFQFASPIVLWSTPDILHCDELFQFVSISWCDQLLTYYTAMKYSSLSLYRDVIHSWHTTWQWIIPVCLPYCAVITPDILHCNELFQFVSISWCDPLLTYYTAMNYSSLSLYRDVIHSWHTTLQWIIPVCLSIVLWSTPDILHSDELFQFASPIVIWSTPDILHCDELFQFASPIVLWSTPDILHCDELFQFASPIVLWSTPDILHCDELFQFASPIVMWSTPDLLHCNELFQFASPIVLWSLLTYCTAMNYSSLSLYRAVIHSWHTTLWWIIPVCIPYRDVINSWHTTLWWIIPVCIPYRAVINSWHTALWCIIPVCIPYRDCIHSWHTTLQWIISVCLPYRAVITPDILHCNELFQFVSISWCDQLLTEWFQFASTRDVTTPDIAMNYSSLPPLSWCDQLLTYCTVMNYSSLSLYRDVIHSWHTTLQWIIPVCLSIVLWSTPDILHCNELFQFVSLSCCDPLLTYYTAMNYSSLPPLSWCDQLLTYCTVMNYSSLSLYRDVIHSWHTTLQWIIPVCLSIVLWSTPDILHCNELFQFVSLSCCDPLLTYYTAMNYSSLPPLSWCDQLLTYHCTVMNYSSLSLYRDVIHSWHTTLQWIIPVCLSIVLWSTPDILHCDELFQFASPIVRWSTPDILHCDELFQFASPIVL